MTPRTLLLEPFLLPKPWGGSALSRFGMKIAPGVPTGEAWLFADISSTSTSGAGGASFHSRFIGEADTPVDLRHASHCWQDGLFGDSSGREHPLLVKLLDAREHLSVQVHPSPLFASICAGAVVKHESWVILHAEQGAEIFAGVRDGLTPDDVVRLCAEGRAREALAVRPAVVGECLTLPSGLVHALGAGVIVAEVQTASDTTYRLYDWTQEYARLVRELHLDQARLAMDCSLQPTITSTTHPLRHLDERRCVVAETDAYRLVLGSAEPGDTTDVPPGSIIVRLSGEGRVDGKSLSSSYAVLARDGAQLEAGASTFTWLEALPAE